MPRWHYSNETVLDDQPPPNVLLTQRIGCLDSSTSGGANTAPRQQDTALTPPAPPAPRRPISGGFVVVKGASNPHLRMARPLRTAITNVWWRVLLMTPKILQVRVERIKLLLAMHGFKDDPPIAAPIPQLYLGTLLVAKHREVWSATICARSPRHGGTGSHPPGNEPARQAAAAGRQPAGTGGGGRPAANAQDDNVPGQAWLRLRPGTGLIIKVSRTSRTTLDAAAARVVARPPIRLDRWPAQSTQQHHGPLRTENKASISNKI